ncbi:hypothetical protein PMAYCL1PPCAC_33300 [Pristionchus mayeri]|uniref:Sidoreflexin n=1 Tax=Pristionchus mayeri TaxID=1317129 RepID=A0AAN5IG47_9BILA|nr:hypothetical protein PMAYCL1PPCAC_33300 [Pristionchus mayeri]
MSELVKALVLKPDISRPRWEQTTFEGRLRHFLTITNPLNLLVGDKQLSDYKNVVDNYKKGIFCEDLTVNGLWKAKHMAESAFHPSTGEKMLIIGRMSAQVPMNMAITGGMLTFYKSPAAVIFWQWLNQSFNAVVNYTNRSGDAGSMTQLLTSYCAATGGALGAALGLNAVVKSAPPLVGRLVPFVAVCVANSINIPMMRRQELTEGITLFDADGNELGKSKQVARSAIMQVVVSRIGMAAPTFVCIPVAMNSIVKTEWYKKRPHMAGPIQVLLAGLILLVSTPVGCALFPQMTPVNVSTLEPALAEQIRSRPNAPQVVFCNKGL